MSEFIQKCSFNVFQVWLHEHLKEISGCLCNMTEPAYCIVSVNAPEVSLQMLKYTALILIAFTSGFI